MILKIQIESNLKLLGIILLIRINYYYYYWKVWKKSENIFNDLNYKLQLTTLSRYGFFSI